MEPLREEYVSGGENVRENVRKTVRNAALLLALGLLAGCNLNGGGAPKYELVDENGNPYCGGRLGGVPERALASQAVLICIGEGRDVPGVIANKSHHATAPEEKYRVVPYLDLYVDAGFDSRASAMGAGVNIGTPVVYRPQAFALGADRVAGTSVDDRAGCAVILEVARALK